MQDMKAETGESFGINKITFEELDRRPDVQ